MDITPERAYELQAKLVKSKLESDTIGGFKAGLTASSSQEQFGSTEPVAGVLFTSGLRQSPSTLFAKEFNRMLLETEMGYRFQERIQEKPGSVEELRSMVRCVVPVVEVPNILFATMDGIGAIDLIGSNVGSSHVVLGPEVEYDPSVIALNEVKVEFFHDGQLVSQGTAHDALGDQWKALLWLVNKTLDGGYIIEDHHILITGALGTILPAVSGHFLGDYGILGKVEFSVK